MQNNIIKDKTVIFGINVAKYYITLRSKRYFEVASQLFRSGTSIGANVHESIWAQSSKDFTHKLEISLKETYETLYRLDVLEQWFKENISTLKNDCLEIKRILISIIKTMKKKYSN